MEGRFFVLSVLLMAGIANAVSLSVDVSSPYATSYPVLLEPGTENAIITVNIESSARIYDLVVSVELDALPFEGVVTSKEIGDLSSFTTLPVAFTLDVAEDASPNTQYPVPMRIYFRDINDDEANYTKIFYITVLGKELIDLGEVTVPAEIYPGDVVNISTKIVNKGTYLSGDLFVSLVYSGTGTFAFTPLTEMEQYMGKVQKDSEKAVSFRLKMDDTVTKGTYPFTLTAQTANSTAQETVYLIVRGKPDIRIATVAASEEKLYPNTDFSLSIQLDNIGSGTADSLKVALLNNPFLGLDQNLVGSIEEDDSGTAIFDFRIPADTESGAYVIPLRVTYLDRYKNSFSFEDTVEVYVYPAPPASPTGYISGVFLLGILAFFGYRYYSGKKKMAKLLGK